MKTDELIALGNKYYNSSMFIEAFDTFQKASITGDKYALLMLGKLYYFGEGVDQDYSKVIEYLTKVENDYEEAMIILGNCYLYELGVKKDINKALDYYLRAANRNDIEGIIAVCYCYKNDVGINDNNKEEYFEYVKRAKELDCSGF